MKRLILVRHGETAWVKEGRRQGIKDIPLSEKGINQARKAAAELRRYKIDIAYTSKLSRAIQTAEEIVKGRNIRLLKTKKLNERSYGIWTGLTFSDIKKKDKIYFVKYENDKYNVKPPRGESLADIKKRVQSFIKSVNQENVLIVSHNGTLRVLWGIIKNLNEKEAADLNFKPAEIKWIKLE
ncbi:MAG: histidine phosphatase family protein [Nanoarchaeota archaeon]|nr:histidine phosphatase family protein [Nanoarchaeota archaeon]MBU1704931.1 histidine phosphatase family protein [Nanoarchaeota archaeon]